jgi:LPS sulfotransferase NodH
MKPCWILCTPRSGSSYISELLNNTGIFPSFEYLFPHLSINLNKNPGPIRKTNAFGEWLRIYNDQIEFEKNIPPYLKVIHRQYLDLIKEDFNPLDLVHDLKLILLKRKNIYKQASSLYLAQEMNQYHVYSNWMMKEFTNKTIDINIEKLTESYNKVLGFNCTWNKFLKFDPLVIHYEDIVNNTFKSIQDIMSYLNIDIKKNTIEKSIDITKKEMLVMTHPIKDKCISILENLFDVSK